MQANPYVGKYPGKFIVLEGGDGCGKTTQIQCLARWLGAELSKDLGSGIRPQVRVTKEPGDTELGRSLRSLLLDPTQLQDPLDYRAELLLYGADRAQHVHGVLRPWLAQGDWVLCDRYTGSTVAYQGYGRGLDLGLIDQINGWATGGLEPDLILWLDVPWEVCQQRLQGRGAGDRLEQNPGDFHRRVYQGFQALAAQGVPWRAIDGQGTEEEVGDRLQGVLRGMGWLGA
jgi:dTMP kinase